MQYLLDENGNVFEKETGIQIELTIQKNYLLETDELSPNGKAKLKRRFTVEEIKARFSKGIIYVDPNFVEDVKPEKEQKLASNGLTFPYLMIMGVPYQSSRIAADILQISHMTVNRRCKKNADGWFYITE